MNSITLKTGSANHSSPQREPPDLPQAISPAADVQHLVKPSAKFSVEWRREVLALTAALEAATKEKDLAASLAFKLQQQHVSFAHAQQKKSAVQTYCSETAGLSRPVPETVDLVQPASTSASTQPLPPATPKPSPLDESHVFSAVHSVCSGHTRHAHFKCREDAEVFRMVLELAKHGKIPFAQCAREHCSRFKLSQNFLAEKEAGRSLRDLSIKLFRLKTAYEFQHIIPLRSYEWWIKTIFLNMCTDVSQLYAVCHFLHLPEDYFGTLPAMQVAVKMPTSSREDAKTLAIRGVQAEALLTSLGVDDPELDINMFSLDSVKSMVTLSLLSHEDLEDLEFKSWNHVPAKKTTKASASASQLATIGQVSQIRPDRMRSNHV